MDSKSSLFLKALAVIDACGAQYRIIMPDGTHHGTLPYATPQPEKKKRQLRHPYGALKAHYMPYVGDIQPGECRDVPWGAFLPGPLMSGISAWGCHEWGNGKVMVATNKTKKCIEVLRLA
jgi:hypothetical protein